MVGSVSGTVTAKGGRAVVIETSGGVGYEVLAAPAVVNAATIGKPLTLFTHHHVREDTAALYGFATREEVEFFRTLISVSGVGPRLALAILATAELAEVQRAIVGRDTALLTGVSGIGRKLAERIIVDLHERLASGAVGSTGGDSGALEALTALGYRADESRRALTEVGTTGDLGDRVKAALQILGRRGIRG
jgi:Holliday junction DNA helicase RuvA